MTNASIPSSFLKTILHNGIGRYVCQLKRVTFKFCKEEPQSRGMRDFLENHMLDFAKSNPGTVVYVQAKRHRTPYLVAEYLNGKSHTLPMPNKTQEEIREWLDWLRTRSGEELHRIRKTQHTFTPSIQSTWTPMTNKPSALNITSFPSSELSAAHKFKPTATEILQSAVHQYESDTSSKKS